MWLKRLREIMHTELWWEASCIISIDWETRSYNGRILLSYDYGRCMKLACYFAKLWTLVLALLNICFLYRSASR